MTAIMDGGIHEAARCKQHTAYKAKEAQLNEPFNVTSNTHAIVDSGNDEVCTDMKKKSAVVDAVVSPNIFVQSTPFVSFARHFRAMMIKRLHSARRDMKLLVFQVILPVVFLLLALFITLARAPAQPAITLDMTLYPDYETNPGEIVYGSSAMYENVFYVSGKSDPAIFGTNYILDYYMNQPTIVFGSQMLNTALTADITTHTHPRYFALAPGGMTVTTGGMSMSAIIMHNRTYSHALPQGLDALYNMARHQLFGSAVPQIVTRNAPMRFGNFENELFTTQMEVVMGLFVVLPFILLPSNIISYIVRENESGSRHLQWLSGANVVAY
uniref:ABC transporter A family member 1 n=1 Tax=Lygus hesperus TaxID=30085 RepID=A0A0A9YHV3_LYGHE